MIRDLIHAAPEADDDTRRADVKVYTSFELMGELAALVVMAALQALDWTVTQYEVRQERMRKRDRARREAREAERQPAAQRPDGPAWVRDWRERDSGRTRTTGGAKEWRGRPGSNRRTLA